MDVEGELQKPSQLLKVPSVADSQLIPELLRTMYREKVNPFTLAEGEGYVRNQNFQLLCKPRALRCHTVH